MRRFLVDYEVFGPECEALLVNGRQCLNMAFVRYQINFGGLIETGWLCKTHRNHFRKMAGRETHIELRELSWAR